MSKLLFGLLMILVFAGCDKGPVPAERSPETTPWFYPEPQIELLTAPDFKTRAVAARNLGKMGAKAEAAIPELEKLLEDKNEKVREIAKEALEKIRAETGG
ncbi:MAG: HEAT repeat domain-containing protein [Planctomycetes bacterium]|nr:HEAT repeat domain-containing protein [Planctomycetota bacterium]